MKIMWEDEMKFNGKQIWVHADFKVIRESVYVTAIRAYDMNPSVLDNDEIEPNTDLISNIEEIIAYELFGK